MKNTVITELIDEKQWAKELFDTRYKRELEEAGFQVVKGSGKWGRTARLVIRDKKGFERISSGENGEIGYSFIAECVRLLDRRKAVLELESLFAQMAVIGWHCDPVFDMAKTFSLTMHDGTERSMPLSLLNVRKLTEEMENRIREVNILELYPRMAGLGWHVDFTRHTVRIGDRNACVDAPETGNSCSVYDYWQEEQFQELMAYYSRILNLTN